MKLDVSDLIEQGLVRKKDYPSGLSVLKYHNKVFYKNLWNKDSRLLDCRGTVVDKDWNVVAIPFRKVFNYKENDTYADVPDDTVVTAVEKVNGFMASVTLIDGEWLVATTGALDSNHVQYAKDMLNLGEDDKKHLKTGFTYLFEIVHENDPHIVNEMLGAYLIGARCIDSGNCVNEHCLDSIAANTGFYRPRWYTMTWGDIKGSVKGSDLEGYMCYSACGAVKLKSPYYLSKKFLMRLPAKRCELLFSNPKNFYRKVDEDFYPVIELILSRFKTVEEWVAIGEQARGRFVEANLKEVL